MFDIILNVKNRKVISQISLEELISTIKNPSITTKKVVDYARTLDKKSKEYSTIKQSLNCFVPNFNHTSYVESSTINKSTGFLYIDVDYAVSVDYSKFDFIVAAWKSLSGVGLGILVAVEGLNAKSITKKQLELAVNTISSKLDITPDKNAISRDRLNALSYDEDIYSNLGYSTLKLLLDNNSNKKLQSNSNKSLSIRLEMDDNFFSNDIRYSNLDSFLEKYTFEDDEVYKDLGDNKIHYCELYIPKTIKDGNRNSKLFQICSMVRGLNPNLKPERLLGFMSAVNNSVCQNPLEDCEIKNMVNRILLKEPELFSNKTKTYLFNPDYMLTGNERRSIAVTQSNYKRAKTTDKKIKALIDNWDYSLKLTKKNISKISGISYFTIIKRKWLKDEIKFAQLKKVS